MVLSGEFYGGRSQQVVASEPSESASVSFISAGGDADYDVPPSDVPKDFYDVPLDDPPKDFKDGPIEITPTPEPATIVLVGTGLLGLWSQRHRLVK